MSWVRAASVDALDAGPLVFHRPPLQISLFRVGARVFAVDNRCPHEGYPLSLGHVGGDCVLTCNWHNWKFRLEDGECVLGGDNVRAYPARIEDGHVLVDLTAPSADEARRETLRGLRTAFDERNFGRTCREIARLHFHGLDPEDALREALAWSEDRLEFGAGHAMAGAADWLSLSRSLGPELEPRVICLSEAVDHLAFDSLRQPTYSYPAPGARFDDDAFVDAIEREDAAAAESMAARALADGLHWADMEEAFARAALAHYNDFGHSLIYCVKAGQLVDMLGDGIERAVVLPMARHLIYTTREDRIPEFKAYAPALEALRDIPRPAAADRRPEVPFPASLPAAIDWLHAALSSSSPEAVYDTMLEALALNMLHFDTGFGVAYDNPVSRNVGWLDFTHGLTFSNAVRRTCSRYPRLWPHGLLQMACFLGRNHGFIDADVSTAEWRVDDPDAFFQSIREKLLDHGMREPIFAVHLLKTAAAVEDESGPASPSCGHALRAALNRFLNSPIKGKHVRRLARQAIALVARDFG